VPGVGVRPPDFPLLLDENIDQAVASALRSQGRDVESVWSRGLSGQADAALLALALREGRVIVTHDSDFGTLAVRSGVGLVGIVYVRPGHIDPAFVMETLDAVAACEVEPEPPFIVVADRRGAGVRIRVRELAKTSAG
jgi:predicted nuclease of predicted toxin-antitoxin system